MINVPFKEAPCKLTNATPLQQKKEINTEVSRGGGGTGVEWVVAVQYVKSV